MKVFPNFSLKSFNTFKIDAKCSFFIEVENVLEVKDVFQSHVKDQKFYILGSGSNTLFSKDFDGYVIHPAIYGIQKIYEDENKVHLSVGAAEDWDLFVKYCTENKYYGIENLSNIPGRVGASPVQNIGAYGVEVCQCIHSVQGIDLVDYKLTVLNKQECNFAYRDSIFKQDKKNKFLITNVVFELSKKEKLIVEYGTLLKEFEQCPEKSIQKLRDLIIAVRNKKLPDILKVGSAGSFFKNPLVSTTDYQQLLINYPDMPCFNTSLNNKLKIPAGWLIEKSGWKGYRNGDAGVYPQQALVLVNYGNATGSDIVHLANQIIQSIEQKFGIRLEMEVNLI